MCVCMELVKVKASYHSVIDVCADSSCPIACMCLMYVQTLVVQ